MPRTRIIPAPDPITPSSGRAARYLDHRIDEVQAELDALRAQRDGTVSAPPPLIRMDPLDLKAAAIERERAEAERLATGPAADSRVLEPALPDDRPAPMWRLRSGATYLSGAQLPQLPKGVS